MNRLQELVEVGDLLLTYSPEGLEIMEEAEAEVPSKTIYVLLTDTKTLVSKVSRMVTGDPYNHVSLMLSDNFDDGIYTFSLGNGVNGIKGGFMVEDRANLKGSHYSMYKMAVTSEAYDKIKTRITDYVKGIEKTSYNHLGLFNAIFKKNIFKTEDGQTSICSEFVVEVLKFSGVELFAKRFASSVRPYELIKSKLLKFHRRGVIKP
ncbi:hypothetical protein D3C71_827900 [compost metagenome]